KARRHLATWAAVGAKVATARERAGLTQRELGARLGLHRSAITRVELGQRQLDALELARLAEVLGRSVEWFLTGPPAVIVSHRAGLSADADVQRLEDELERTARDVELLSEVNALSIQPVVLPSGVTTLDEAEAGAAQARTLLARGDGPLTDLQGAVERVGLLVARGSLSVGDIGRRVPGELVGCHLPCTDVGADLSCRV